MTDILEMCYVDTDTQYWTLNTHVTQVSLPRDNRSISATFPGINSGSNWVKYQPTVVFPELVPICVSKQTQTLFIQTNIHRSHEHSATKYFEYSVCYVTHVVETVC